MPTLPFWDESGPIRDVRPLSLGKRLAQVQGLLRRPAGLADEECRAARTLLASDAAGAITGIVMPVDSGHLLAGSFAPYGGFAPVV